MLSLEKQDSLDDEYKDDGSDSRYTGLRHFTFHFPDSVGCVDDSVDRVRGVDYGVFVPIEIESNCDVFLLVVFISIGVESKGGRLIELFWRPKS